MYYSVLLLPNGTELKGGEAGSILKALTLHTAVNAGQEFTIGSAFSDYIEAEIWADPGGSLQITAGDALTYYRQDDAGSRTKVGVFYAEKPTRTKRNSYKVTAYDTMSKLDADFSGWLHANQAQFPKTIWQLVQLACQRAGVTLASSSLPINGSYSVQAFYADDLTCRQIISWAAEAAGCYAHMNADGKLQFLTYADKRSTAKITPDGASNSTAYYADSLSYEDYTVKAIEKVQIRQSDSDVGVIYPDSTTATNTYVVQGNLILGSESFKNAELKGNAVSGSSVTYNDTGSATVTNANSNRYFVFNTVDARITKGVTLCLSVMYKLISGTDGLCLSLTYDADNGNHYVTSIKTENQLEIKQTDGWVLRYGTWTPSDTGILKTVELGCGSIRAGLGGKYTNKFSMLHPMLQYGNAPTAWNASSGDYLTQESAKSLFSQTADEIKTEVTKSVTETVTANVKDTATSAANDAVDSKLQDYATTATVNTLKEDVSSISQKADSISTKVSSLEETTTTISNDLDSTKREFKTVKESVSAIDQKADSITQTVTQRITGGNNIIAGTDDWNNATLDAGGNDLSKKGTYTISGESVRVTNRAQNTRFHFGADKTLVIAKGMTYCASVLYKLNSGTDSLFLQFETKSSSGTKSYYGSAFKQAQQDIELDNGWKLRWAAFTATADGYADGLFVSTANDNATVTNDLTIMHPMVQMGNAPTAWTASTGDYLTANETKTEIKQTVGEIKLTASTSGTSSTIKLTAGGAEITSAQINLSGVVTFSDLSTWNQDKTIINGGNITTGQIHNKARTTTYDLDNAWIRMGKDAGTRVDIDTGRIRWYWENNLTGVLSSRYGKSYIGDNSRYTFLGWFSTGDPSFDYSTGGATSEFVGIAIDQVDKVIHCNASKFEIPGRIECGSLSVNGREI